MKMTAPLPLNPVFNELDSILEKMIDRTEEKHFYQALAKMIRRWPQLFENDLLKLSQHFLALLEQEFKKYRTKEHQLRMLCSFYLMRKNLFRQLHLSPNELLLDVRLLPTYLEFPFSRKQVMGLVIAVHLPTRYESLEERHILRAVQRFFPEVRSLQESFLILQKAREPFRLLYLEVNKATSGCYFSTSEISHLKQHLKEELKKHVETLSPSVFGFQNAEETLRNILVLSRECTNDIPQTMIFFENSSAKSLTFRVIVVRILSSTSQPIAHYFQPTNDKLFDFIPERSSIVGETEDSCSKEASVFCLRILKHPSFLRANSSLNLYQAREYVFSLLEEALGELRDYNGGLFSKQSEAFKQFKGLFKEVAEKEPMLLEDFFHSLQPIEMQAIISLDVLAKLFELFLQVTARDLPKNESYLFKVNQEESLLFVVIFCRSTDFAEKLTQKLEQTLFSKEIEVSSSVTNRLDSVISYIYRSPCPEKRQSFCQTIEHTLEAWFAEKKSLQTLRLSVNHFVLSLDPRMGGDLVSSQILKGLFEGLMRIGQDGKPSFGVAESLEISQDGKIYLFKLKDSYWNNGDRVTAYDFYYAWTTILSPQFSTAFAHLFYPIKNAKSIRNSQVSLDEVGIQVLNAHTLQIELEYPCPYFLELTAHPLYSPVHHKIDQIHPNWSLQTGEAYICNGPFQLKNTTPQEMHELEKNPLYWDIESVQLDRIIISRSNAQQAVEMFKNNEIDWVGWPLRTWEPFFSHVFSEKAEKLPMGSICWCLFNTQQFPFHSSKIRKALAYALDRQAILDLLSFEGSPVFSPLLSKGLPQIKPHISRINEAICLFEEGLKELSIERSQLPELTFTHPNNTLRKNMASAIIHQWKQILGLHVNLQGLEFRTAFSKITKGEYQIGMMGWRPWITDPSYTLNIFKTATEEINFSKWEHSEYSHLLSQAAQETNSKKKTEALKAAEAILIQEAPLIPLFYEEAYFIKSESLVCFLPPTSVTIDLKYLSLKNREVI